MGVLDRAISFPLPAEAQFLLAVAVYKTPDGSIQATCDTGAFDELVRGNALTGAELLDVVVVLQRAARVVANEAVRPKAHPPL